AHAVVALGGRLVADRGARGARPVDVGGLGVVPRGGDVRGDGADWLGADDRRVLDRGLRELGDLARHLRVDRALLALAERGGVHLGAADDTPGAVLAEREVHHAEVRGARAGLHDRPLRAVLAGDGGGVVVGAVGVAVEDRVDVGAGAADGIGEDRVGVLRGDAWFVGGD